ncbi:MAG: metalloregulator ArsR/SmtB family transcription factor [Polyangiaceae bacterium]
MTQPSKHATGGQFVDRLPLDLFKALADGTRLKLLSTLAVGGRTQTVSEVAGCCSVDLSVVSRHLKTLERAGVLASTKVGKSVHYRVRVTHLVQALRGLADALESCCPEGSPTIVEGSSR